MDAAVQSASTEHPVHYERRRPEQTFLYPLVAENVETFFAQIEAETGASLPDFVKDEFEAFLDCGTLADGFLHLRCEACAHEKLVAFSCKRGGVVSPVAHGVWPRPPLIKWIASSPVYL